MGKLNEVDAIFFAVYCSLWTKLKIRVKTCSSGEKIMLQITTYVPEVQSYMII